MTPLQEHVEHWLNSGYGHDQIIRCAERIARNPDEEDIVQADELRRIGEKWRATDEFDGWFQTNEWEDNP